MADEACRKFEGWGGKKKKCLSGEGMWKCKSAFFPIWIMSGEDYDV